MCIEERSTDGRILKRIERVRKDLMKLEEEMVNAPITKKQEAARQLIAYLVAVLLNTMERVEELEGEVARLRNGEVMYVKQ